MTPVSPCPALRPSLPCVRGSCVGCTSVGLATWLHEKSTPFIYFLFTETGRSFFLPRFTLQTWTTARVGPGSAQEVLLSLAHGWERTLPMAPMVPAAVGGCGGRVSGSVPVLLPAAPSPHSCFLVSHSQLLPTQPPLPHSAWPARTSGVH